MRPPRTGRAMLVGALALLVGSLPVAQADPTPPSATPTSQAPGTSSAATSTATNAAPEQGVEQVPVQGLIYVSALRTSYQPSWNPFGGTLHIEFQVRNAATVPVSGSAQFWATHFMGGRIARSVTVPVDALEVGETRVVSADIGELGQWALVTAHASFTPPQLLGTQALSPMERDQGVFFVPWWMLLGLGLAVALVHVLRQSMHRRPLEPIDVPEYEEVA